MIIVNIQLITVLQIYLANKPNFIIFQYEEFLNESATGSEVEDFDVYFKLLYNQGKAQQVLSCAEDWFEKHCSDTVFCEWVCKVSSEMYIEDRAWLRERDWCRRLPHCYQPLLHTDDDNVLALLAKSVCLIEQRTYLEARDCLTRCKSCLIKRILLFASQTVVL